MFAKIVKRLKEPSTYAGVAGVLASSGVLFKDDNLPVIADAITQGGDAYMATGNEMTALGVLITSLLAIFIGEKK